MTHGEAWFVAIVLFLTMLAMLGASELLARVLEPITKIGG